MFATMLGGDCEGGSTIARITRLRPVHDESRMRDAVKVFLWEVGRNII